MNANIKKAVTKFAKQDLKIAKTKGSVTVCQCVVFGEKTNVDINRNGDGTFDIIWGRMAENSWKSCNEQLVIGFMMDAYQVEVA